MKWKQQVINGEPQKYGIQSVGHEYRIGKFTVDSGALCTLYGLWHGAERIGYYPDPYAAKDAAESHLLSLSRKDTGNGRAGPSVPALPAVSRAG